MILKLQGYHSPWRDAVRRFTEKFLLKVPYLYFSSCKCWWIQLLCYHPRCNRFLPSHNPPDARTPVTLLKHSPWGFIEEAGSGAPLGDRGMRILVVFNNWNQELSLFGKRNRLRQRELLQISCQHWFQHWFWSLNVIYSVVLRCYISFVSVNLWFWANVSPFLWLLLVELWNQLLYPPSF